MLLTKVISLFFLIILAMSCGQDVFKADPQDSEKPNGYFAALNAAVEVNAIIPDREAVPTVDGMGDRAIIQFRDIDYLIGKETSEQIQTFLYNLPKGEHTLEIKGRFQKEKGYQPDPEHEYYVVHITEVITK